VFVSVFSVGRGNSLSLGMCLLIVCYSYQNADDCIIVSIHYVNLSIYTASSMMYSHAVSKIESGSISWSNLDLSDFEEWMNRIIIYSKF
ncbi:MAG TPA: hypothetical protein VE548_07085, partial [Nitrososphaeraceae archaeon]|nr:hypothetical protein [Nitrososphaeraceae archaeon]